MHEKEEQIDNLMKRIDRRVYPLPKIPTDLIDV